MSNFSNAKWAINYKKQADKDTPLFDDLRRLPILYSQGTGFAVSPDADTFQDVVNPIMESSKTQILGAGMGGGVILPADTNFLAFALATILGSVVTTNPGTSAYQHVITPTNDIMPNFHSGLYSDGTCDQQLVGLVASALTFGADFQNRRINAQVGFAGIRMQDNQNANSGTVTVANATDIWTRNNHGYEPGDMVALTNAGGALPAGTVSGTFYYVEPIDANTFYLHTSYLGSLGKLLGTRVVVSDDGTGTQTITKSIIVYPNQQEINPIHFINVGANLTITINGGSPIDLTNNWAGFNYALEDGISAEQRAGSNTIRVIERVERAQSLELMLDYNNDTFKRIIRNYQRKSEPDKITVSLTLQGREIETGYNFRFTAQFYNCNLLDHDYNRDRTIGKQVLPLSVNHDTVENKSVTWTVINTEDGYLT